MSSDANRPRNDKPLKQTNIWRRITQSERRSKHSERTAEQSKILHTEQYAEEEEQIIEASGGFHPLKIVAALIFLSFISLILLVSFEMWRPQQLSDLPGYHDKTLAKDLSAFIRHAGKQEIRLTEAEINSYLGESCRIRQKGISALLAQPSGVALRCHDGYGELIIERMLGTNIKHSVSVYLSFSRHVVNGTPVIELELSGGKPILGHFPRGGHIGHLPLPQRYMQILTPGLESLAALYPDFSTLVLDGSYLPSFRKATNTQEGLLILSPL